MTGSKPSKPDRTSTSTNTDTKTDVNAGKITSQGSKTGKLDKASEGNAQ